jgi:hypothetical protein
MSSFDLYLKQTFFEEIPTTTLKAYAFDWDDNIQFLPTKIVLNDPSGNFHKDFSTEEFAIARTKPDILQLVQEGYSWDFSAFMNDDEFFKDQTSASNGPSWNDFVECINSASLFSIITARGHSVPAYKKTIYNMITSNKDGIDKDKVLENIKSFREAVSHNIDLSDEQLIKKYVNQGRYYPVNNPEIKSMLGGEGGSASPEALKIKAFQDFKEYVNKMSGVLIKKIGDREVKIGFSDDDKRNYMAVKDANVDDPRVVTKYTGE